MTGLRVVQGQGNSQQPPDGDAVRLLRFAIDNRDGFTWRDVEDEFNWNRVYFYAVVRRVREDLADEPETLICNPNPIDPRGPWTYSLTADTDATRTWHRNRLDDCESRLETIVNVAASAERANNGRTRDGRRARILRRTATRALEDLAELRENSA